MSITANKLINLIEGSDVQNIEKSFMIGFVERQQEHDAKEMGERDLIKDVARVYDAYEVILSTDEVKIYKVMGRWEPDHPYRIIINKDGVWRNVSEVVATFDDAFLLYLREKHLGSNSDFVHFVKKMLAK